MFRLFFRSSHFSIRSSYFSSRSQNPMNKGITSTQNVDGESIDSIQAGTQDLLAETEKELSIEQKSLLGQHDLNTLSLEERLYQTRLQTEIQEMEAAMAWMESDEVKKQIKEIEMFVKMILDSKKKD